MTLNGEFIPIPVIKKTLRAHSCLGQRAAIHDTLNDYFKYDAYAGATCWYIEKQPAPSFYPGNKDGWDRVGWGDDGYYRYKQ